MNLDSFLPSVVKLKQVEERCADLACRKIIKGIKYTLKIKGKEGVYCQVCAKRILRPRENAGETL